MMAVQDRTGYTLSPWLAEQERRSTSTEEIQPSTIDSLKIPNVTDFLSIIAFPG